MKREEIVSFLNEAEQKFSVHQWTYDQIDFWPMLKMLVFFQIFNQANSKSNLLKQNKKVFAKKAFNKLRSEWRKINPQKRNKTLHLEKADVLFAGAVSHRTNFNGVSYNKFSDPIMDQLSNEGLKAIQIDYTRVNSETKYYKNERIFDATLLYPKHNAKIEKVELGDLDKLKTFLKEVENQLGISATLVQSKLCTNIREVLVWKNIWLEILEQTQPKIVFGLCYYNVNMYGLNLACKQKGILFGDIQHGGQGKQHVCYYFENHSIKNLNTIPDLFWIWDESDQKPLSDWLGEEVNERTLVGGNPWMKFSTDHSVEDNRRVDKILEGRKMILYTLQHSLPDIFPIGIYEAIKNSSKEFIWWFRMHPGMPEEQKKEIYNFVTSNNFMDKVFIENENPIPLPIVIERSFAHISKFSGSLAEAAMAGIDKNFTIDAVGRDSFKSLIEVGKLEFVDVFTENSLTEKLFDENNVSENTTSKQSFNYYELLKKYLHS